MDHNLEKYESTAVVAHYEAQTELQPCERYLFGKYVEESSAILDIGVGAGRTTPFLASKASRYVGIDYSQAMVDACRRRFPAFDFQHCDATALAAFESSAFDVAVFSFNGIDYIRTSDLRQRCFSEVARVLKPGGLFLFSSHNARQLIAAPTLSNARPHQMIWRTVRSAAKSAQVATRTLLSGAFLRGEGYILDAVHGGLNTYASIPQTVRPQLASAGLRLVETVRGPDPKLGSDLLTPWHYYVSVKADHNE